MTGFFWGVFRPSLFLETSAILATLHTFPIGIVWGPRVDRESAAMWIVFRSFQHRNDENKSVAEQIGRRKNRWPNKLVRVKPKLFSTASPRRKNCIEAGELHQCLLPRGGGGTSNPSLGGIAKRPGLQGRGRGGRGKKGCRQAAGGAVGGRGPQLRLRADPGGGREAAPPVGAPGRRPDPSSRRRGRWEGSVAREGSNGPETRAGRSCLHVCFGPDFFRGGVVN